MSLVIFFSIISLSVPGSHGKFIELGNSK